MFGIAGDSSHDVDVGNPESSMGYLETRHGKDILAAHMRARRMLLASLEGKREQDLLLRLHPPAAVWRKLADVFSPETNGARLALLEKFDGVKLGVRDNPEQKLLEMEDTARDLNSFKTHQSLSEDHILIKFLHALTPEYNTQKQLPEDREGPLSQ